MTSMVELVTFLIDNYFSYYDKKHGVVTTPEQVATLLYGFGGQIAEVRTDELIAVGLYLRLTDTSFKKATFEYMSNPRNFRALMNEDGDNYHFIIVASKDAQGLLKGVMDCKKRKAKTISWYDNKRILHEYKLK